MAGATVQDTALSEHLLAQGRCTRAQLDEALQAQAVYGATLATNLVELGVISLDDVAEQLAEATGCALAPKEWVDAPEAEALASLSTDVASRHVVLPLRYVGEVLHVAMVDPTDARELDAVKRALRRGVHAYILPELRLRYALERHLGIPRPVRFVNVAKRLERVRREGASAHDDVPEEIRLRASLGIAPLAGDEELVDETEFAQMHARLAAAREEAQGGPAPSLASEPDASELMLEQPAPEEPTAPAAGADDLLALEASLATAPDGDAAARAALAIARRYVPCAVIFVVHGGMVMGLLADGDGVVRRVDGILVPLDADSVFARAAAACEPFRGAPPASGVDARVLRALGRSAAKDVAVLPVRVGRRAVNLLYADGGPGPLARTSLGALQALAGCMTGAYERIVLARKQAS